MGYKLWSETTVKRPVLCKDRDKKWWGEIFLKHYGYKTMQQEVNWIDMFSFKAET